jgi:branched-subunit amino acid ABC-type transport system permease component
MNGFPFFINLLINGIVEGLIIALAALSLTLVFAVARFANAATGDYMTLGAYAALGMQMLTGASIVVNIIVAGIVTSILSIIFFRWVFQRLAGQSSVTALVASIGIAFFIRSVLTFFVGHDQYAFKIPVTRAINLYGVLIYQADIYLTAVTLLALGGVFSVLYLTPIGRRMRAVADNFELARISGIRSSEALIIMWAIVGAVSGIGGVILGIKSVIMPEMGWDLLLPAFAAMILGGVGNPVGAVFGGLCIGIAQELSSLVVGYSYKIAVAFLALLLILLWRPHGLLGYKEAIR